MAGALGRLNIDMTLNTARFNSAIQQSERQAVRFGQQLTGQLRIVVREQESIAAQAARSSAAVSGFFKSAATFLSVRQVVSYADSWTELQNRLKLVTGSSQELTRATTDVYGIAQKTRQSLDSTAQVYQRFADNAERLGLSQQRVASLTDTVSKAVAISGASAASAEAALMQFGQALASGQLRGQELNSVMEQTPGLARAIADGMGVSIGQLRKMAADGDTSIEQIITALERAKSGVDQKFATSTATVSQSFTNLQSAITKYVGEANDSSGATQVLTAGLSGLAANLGDVVKVAETLAAAAIAVKMAKWTQTMRSNAAEAGRSSQALLKRAFAERDLAADVSRRTLADKNAMATARSVALEEYKAAKGADAQAAALKRLTAVKSLARKAALDHALALKAENAAQAGINSARRGASAAARGLGGAVSMLGGPVGIVTGLLIGGGMAYSNYRQKTEEAKQASLEFAESLDVTAESLKKMSAIDRAAAIQKMADAIDAQGSKEKELRDEIERTNKIISESTQKRDNAGSVTGFGRNSFAVPDQMAAQNAARERTYALKELQDAEQQHSEMVAKMVPLLQDLERATGKVSAAYAESGKYLVDVSSRSNELISKINLQGTAYDNLTASIHQATQAQQQFSAQSLVTVSDDAQKSIDLSNRAIAKANAKGRELARLTAEDMLASRKIKPDMKGYDKALDAEISAQMVLQEKRNTRTPRKSKVDYKKQYTDMVSEMENKLSSLIADGKSIREYGTTSSFKEYDSLMADIARNQEKFSHFGKVATDKLKIQAKAIDEVAQANAVATMSYDRTKEIEQLRFETELIGKNRTEQERLTYFRQLDLQVQQMRVGMSDKNVAALEAETQKIREQYAEWQKQSELLRQSPAEGFKAGLKDFGDSATDVMGNVRNITTGALTNMTDMLNNFVMTGKASFGDFARSVLSDISKMLLKMALFNAVKAGGSAMGFSMDFMGGFAGGGYTGHGGKFEPKGIVHGGEFVFTKEATARLGVANLYRLMNSAKGYASGGYVGGRMPAVAGTFPVPAVSSAPQVNITINGSGNTDSQATGGYEQFGREVGQFVDQRFRRLMDKETRPSGSVWNLVKGKR